MASSPDITQLLIDWSRGDAHVQEQLLPLVYAELHAIAARHMGRERAGHPLQATDLVHDAYLRLIDQKRVQWQNRAHFFALASQMMRRILVDHARRRIAVKHGGGTFTISLDEAATVAAERAGELVALDDALEELATIDPRRARVVELRYFGGLSLEETGHVLGIAPNTVMRDWTLAKAWLLKAVTS